MLNKGIFWVNIVISKLNLLYRYCSKLIGELRKEREFRQHCCRNSTKIRRENFGNTFVEIQKGGERKKRNFGNIVILVRVKKNNCGNVIVEIGKKRNFFLVIMAMALSKMKKKN